MLNLCMHIHAHAYKPLYMVCDWKLPEQVLWVSLNELWTYVEQCVCVCAPASQTHGCLPIKTQTHHNIHTHTQRYEHVHEGICTTVMLRTVRDIHKHTNCRACTHTHSSWWGDGPTVINCGMLSVMCMNDECSKVSRGKSLLWQVNLQ